LAMAAKSTRADKARQAAQSAGSNPYVRRLIEDGELRNSVKEAFEAARHAYQRMSNGKGPVRAVTEDKKVQRDLRSAAESLREASDRLRGRTKKRHWGRLLVIALVGAGLAIALSEDLRKAVLDRLFGAEEEFEYSSTTAPETADSPSS
jgi:glucose/arabinose dehydrogenase